jgi:predicted small integral membrane protein
MSDLATPLVVAALVAAAVLVVLAAAVWRRGRPFAQGDVFRASRLSRGNRLFPTQVLITPTSVVHHTPQWIGKMEHSIHMAHVASVSIDTHLLFSDVYIETTGGTTPIACRGHRKGDAVEMKRLIEEYQTAYYRVSQASSPSGAPPAQ